MNNRFLQILVGLCVAVGTLYLSFRNLNFSEMLGILAEINAWYLLPTLVAVLFSHWVRAWRWKLLFPEKNVRTGIYPFFSSTMVGYAVNNAIPRGGEVAKAMYLARTTGKSQSAVFGTVILERLLDFLILLFTFGLSLLWFSEPIDQFFPGLGTGAGLVLIVVVASLSIVTFLPEDLIRRIVIVLTAWTGNRVQNMVLNTVLKMYSGLSGLKSNSNLLSVSVASLLIFLLYVLGTWIPLFCFSFQSELNLSFPAGIAIMAISAVGMIIPSPGGTGTFHLFCSGVLINLFGVGQADALAFATLIHLLNLVSTTILGAALFLYDRAHRKVNPGA